MDNLFTKTRDIFTNIQEKIHKIREFFTTFCSNFGGCLRETPNGAEEGLGKLSAYLGNMYISWLVIYAQTALFYSFILISGFAMVKHPYPNFASTSCVIFTIIMVLATLLKIYSRYDHRVETIRGRWENGFPRLNMLLKAGLNVAVMYGFAVLGLKISEDKSSKGWVMVYFLSCYCFWVRLTQLFGGEDHMLGIPYGLVAIAVCTFKDYKDQEEFSPVAFYGIVFVLTVFFST